MKNLLKISPLLLLMACGSSAVPLPEIVEQYLYYQPSNFPEPAYDFSKNPVTEEGFELGKALFYDGKLSRDNTISCAECHSQPYAFTHHGHTLSHGIDDKIGKRNAPPIQNMAFQNRFFWDGGVFDLDLFSVSPITNPVEMDEQLGNVLQKLRDTPGYPEKFEAAFGSKEITTERFLKALSQFMNSLVSANAPYDKYIRGEGSLSDKELSGLRIYQTNCASCHASDLFTDHSFRNNGLEVYERDPDLGRYIITENTADKYKFKVPSLRNVQYTAPYMHDGRFNTLKAVIEHYSTGVKDSETLDPLLKNGSNLGIALTAAEKEDLLAFLYALSDESFIKNPKYAAP